MTSKKRTKKIERLTRHDDLPASVGMFKELRAELGSKIASVDLKVDSLDRKIDLKFDSLDQKFVAFDQRFEAIDYKFDALELKMESKFNEVISAVHGVRVVVEEQRSENRIVLDNLKNLNDRQDRLEIEVKDIRQTVDFLGRAVPRNPAT